MKGNLRTIKIGILFAIVALFAHTAEAASIFLVPSSGEFRTGGSIAVDLKIDSNGTGLNAAQATVRFPKETLQVVSIEKSGSAFSFWLEEPNYSNDTGVISFVGGTPYGISGASIEVLKITFKSKGSGVAPITIVDAAVTASDGSGTNLLSKIESASYTISPTAISPTGVTPSEPGTPSAAAAPSVPAPQQIVREATVASGLPAKPAVTVSLYPDQTQWYNATNVFNARWALSSDVSRVAAVLNRQPTFEPDESEGLFDNKSFSALSDGTWYIHVRFRNSIGWGPTTHYRIAVDTEPPLPFQITTNESASSDNPSPVFIFKTTDALSGVKEYRARAGSGNWSVVSAKNFPGSFALPIDTPGKNHIIIQAVDYAGNSIENSIDHETTAITSPSFTFVSEQLYSDQPQGLSLKGTALPSTEVLLAIKSGDALVSSSTILSDAQGNWEFNYTAPLRNGTYIASIQNKDARGARSFVIYSPEIHVSGKYTSTIVFLLVVLTGAIMAGTWHYKRRREQTALRIEVAGSDASKVFKIIENDIEKLNKARTTTTPADDDFAIQKMTEDVKKMGGYVQEEISKAKK